MALRYGVGFVMVTVDWSKTKLQSFYRPNQLTYQNRKGGPRAALDSSDIDVRLLDDDQLLAARVCTSCHAEEVDA